VRALLKSSTHTPTHPHPPTKTYHAHSIWALGVLAFEAVTLERPFAQTGGASMTLGALARRVQAGQGSWHLLGDSLLRDLVLAMLSPCASARPSINDVLLCTPITNALGGFLRDLAAGRFAVKADKAETLFNQVSSIGLRGLALAALRAGRLARRSSVCCLS